MALFDELKSIAKVLQEAGKRDPYEKLLSIQQELLDMQKNLVKGSGLDIGHFNCPY